MNEAKLVDPKTSETITRNNSRPLLYKIYNLDGNSAVFYKTHALKGVLRSYNVGTKKQIPGKNWTYY